eukprot:TRINITY_DN1124_c0_g1_i2.p1 TRINITY_DN1124_c0_g1~~TRINITY_DN1124_c0_g1_i2.p1  ORF type:complete len:197 (-),score=45.13 TRINITY_DN1124_c0_g1_i2:106-696(-)
MQNADKKTLPRRKLPLDNLISSSTPSSSALIKGYTDVELSELLEKMEDLESEIISSLNYNRDFEIVGAKLDEEQLHFYVRWESGESSFIPSKILNKLSPDKVIQFYEKKLTFKPQSKGDDIKSGVDNMKQKLSPGGTYLDKSVASQQHDRLLLPTKNLLPGHKTTVCTQCSTLLQFKEEMTAIKCPSCSTIMRFMK